MSWNFELVAGPYGSPLDGPVWDGEALLFTRQAVPANSINNRIMRYDPVTGAVTDFRRWTNQTIGLAFSADGALYGCQSAGRRLVRFNADGTTSALAHKIGGLYHNKPKDLVVDRRGRIWFCDPHGDLRTAFYPQIPDKLEHASVLRLEHPDRPDSDIIRMTHDTDAPWAVLLSRDESTLYVAESSNEPSGVRELRAYPVLEDGSLGPYTLLHMFGSDLSGVHQGICGMCLDSDGNIVACAGWRRGGPGPMVYLFAPSGRILETYPLLEEPTNCAFGDPGLDSLYVTTRSGSLYRAGNTGRQGWTLYGSD
jgi:gluconolactonase